MENKKVLLVYYSRTGVTKQVSNLMVNSLKCDIEEIEDTKSRKGIWGFIVSGKDSVLNKETIIKKTEKNPSDYDLVIIGTPIWAGNMSCGIRTYINQNKGKFNNVAVFTTSGGGNNSKALENMKNTCGVEPLVTLSLRDKEVKSGVDKTAIESFIKKLRSKVNNSPS